MADPVNPLLDPAFQAAVADVRARLPLLEDSLALNHAGIAPQPLSAAVASYEESRGRRLPLAALATVAGARPRLRELYGQLLNISADEVAITKHTAEGVNIIAQGFPWKSGDEILTVNVEYPSNVYPWWNVKERGVTVRTVPERNGRVDLAELEAAVTPRTRLLALSHVEFASGFAFSIPELVALARRHGLFLFLDVAQSIGVLPVDLSGVDAAAWPTWKWLMGPLGMGGFYLARRHFETIKPIFVGGDGMVPTADYLEYSFTPRPDASRFEYSTENVAGLVGCREALERMVPLMDRVPAMVRANADRVMALMTSRGYRLYSSTIPSERSGITSFEFPGEPAPVMARLKEAGIECALRAGRLRLSPHYYNTASDLERLAVALDAGAGAHPQAPPKAL